MQWIILIGNDKFDINSIRNIEHNGVNKFTELTPNRVVVDYGEDHIFYEYAEDVINDYEEEELIKIPFNNPHFVIMTYTSEELMKKVLQQENFIKDIYIDDDQGNIIPIEQFIL